MKFALSVAMNDPGELCELAKVAEEAGWDSISLADHIIYPEKLTTPYPYTPDGSPRWDPPTPWPDPWVAIGAMAAVTERLRFYTNVYVLPARNPFLVAKTVGTAAVMSGNRIALGVGMGWMEQEFDVLEQDFRQRGKRADEMLQVLPTLWQGGMVEHHGEFYDFDRMQMSPVPSEPVPIYVGGFSKPAMRRAARHDGWISDLHTLDELRGYLQEVQGYRRELGRENLPFEVCSFNCMDAMQLEGMKQMEEMGVTTLCTLPWIFYGVGMDKLQPKLDAIRRFADDFIAPFR